MNCGRLREEEQASVAFKAEEEDVSTIELDCMAANPGLLTPSYYNYLVVS